MLRLYEPQLDALAEALGEDPVGRVEVHLRRHYPEDCAGYEPADLRAWIQAVLASDSAYSNIATDELFLQISKRWVLRAFLGGPALSPRKDRSP